MAKGAIIYGRVSTKNQEEEGTSLETQIAAAIEFAEAQGRPVLKVYREVYTGAELYDRPLLNEARQEIKTGQYSHLIAYSIDRLNRDPIHLAIIAMECERSGVELMFVTEPLDNTPEGALIRYVRGYAAQVEREKIRERCVRGKRAIAMSGRVHRSGTELYGYLRDKMAGKRTINESEAVIVRRIFAGINRGASIRGTVVYLNTEGVPPPSTGKRVYKDGRSPIWCKTAVTRILRDPTYKGQAIAWRWKGSRVGGRQRIIQRPVEEQIPLPEGTAPAIVSPQTWDTAQKAIQANGGAATRNAVRSYLLRSFIYCWKCGERCYTENCKGRRYYRCSSRQKRAGACGARSTPANDCEREVWDQFVEVVLNPERIRDGLRRVRDGSEQTQFKADLNGARQELQKSVAGLQRLLRRFRATESPTLIEAIEAEVKTTEAEQARLRLRIAELEAQSEGQRRFEAEFQSVQGYSRQIAPRLNLFEFEDKVQALRAFRTKIKANGRMFELAVDIAGFGGTFGGGGDCSGRRTANRPQYTEVVAGTPLIYIVPPKKRAA